VSHVTIYSLAMMGSANANERENRELIEKLVVSELKRNFLEVSGRMEDALGNLRLLLKVNEKSAPGKTGDVEITIKKDKTMSVDVSNTPGNTCVELTKPLEMVFGPPLAVKYKTEFRQGKARLPERKKVKGWQ
jgi:hypothetical protein